MDGLLHGTFTTTSTDSMKDKLVFVSLFGGHKKRVPKTENILQSTKTRARGCVRECVCVHARVFAQMFPACWDKSWRIRTTLAAATTGAFHSRYYLRKR